MTKTNQVLEAFKNGEELTSAQITARYGVANPREIVRVLRQDGYAIYLNEHKNSKGHRISKYRLGTPSRKMVAAAYAVLGNEIFA